MRDRWNACTCSLQAKEDDEHVHLDGLSEVVASTFLLNDLDDDCQMTEKHRCDWGRVHVGRSCRW